MAITYGYIRVSTADQNEARQIDAMALAGVDRANVIIDKQSGKDFNRPGWKKLKRKIRNGDLIIVQSLDRLGRNYTEVIDEWRNIAKGKGAYIRVLDMPLLDTANKSNDLIEQFVTDMVLRTLSFAAENERRNIRERQRQGIAAAKLRGVRFGRPRHQLPDNFTTCADMVRSQKISIGKGAILCGMKKTSFWRAIKSAQNSGVLV